MTQNNYKIIISGGGTGGHVFPAISIADEIKARSGDTEILFVGAKGKMEMEKVPEAGYRIIGLPIKGFKRKFSLSNLMLIYLLVYCIIKSRKIIRSFKPNLVIGVGGYASWPILKVASGKKIPILLQEQNSYGGIVNRIFAKKAFKICVAYDNMDKYFPKTKIKITGNPLRQNLEIKVSKLDEAKEYFNIIRGDTILILGGSLGAESINNAVLNNLGLIGTTKLNFIWQTGKIYFERIKNKLKNSCPPNLFIHEFINRMDLAYAVSNVIISRSGALSISELCFVGKPVIFVPSPNVAEDHQTKNALALSSKNAAIYIKDKEAKEKMIKVAIEILGDEKKKNELSKNIKQLAIKNSAQLIVDEIFNVL